MELVEAGENLHGVLDISPAQQRHLETKTQGQSKSQAWVKYQAGRITASKLFQVVHTDPLKPSISLTCVLWVWNFSGEVKFLVSYHTRATGEMVH